MAAAKSPTTQGMGLHTAVHKVLCGTMIRVEVKIKT